MQRITRLQDIKAYTTRDGSLIRELMHPAIHGNRNQSLAEAIIASGQRTVLHRHMETEEIYHITLGHGLMTLAEDQFEVKTGDTICIPPGTPHCIENNDNGPLHILCICTPSYRHEDTILMSDEGQGEEENL